LRYRSDGVAVAHFDVVVTERHQVDGHWRTRSTTLFACSAWRGLAEHIHASIFRGDRVVVVGRIRQRPTLGGDIGSYRYDIVVDDLGPSLRFANMWPIPTSAAPGESGEGSASGVVVSDPPRLQS
jgi:single-strand DNA-binding protein